MPATGLAYVGQAEIRMWAWVVAVGLSWWPCCRRGSPCCVLSLPVCGSSSWCSCNLRPALTYNTLAISQSSKRSLTVNSCAQPSAKIRVL